MATKKLEEVHWILPSPTVIFFELLSQSSFYWLAVLSKVDEVLYYFENSSIKSHRSRYYMCIKRLSLSISLKVLTYIIIYYQAGSWDTCILFVSISYPFCDSENDYLICSWIGLHFVLRLCFLAAYTTLSIFTVSLFLIFSLSLTPSNIFSWFRFSLSLLFFFSFPL